MAIKRKEPTVEQLNAALDNVMHLLDEYMNEKTNQSAILETGTSHHLDDSIETYWAKVEWHAVSILQQWCSENLSNTPIYSDEHIYFTNRDDFAMFILRWYK